MHGPQLRLFRGGIDVNGASGDAAVGTPDGVAPAEPSQGHPERRASPPDGELIRLCLQGDEAAWETLIRRYSALVYSVARRYRLNENESADVFQSVCLALWEGLGSLRETTKLGSWLITVTARTAWHGITARERLATAPLDGMDPSDGVANLPEEEVLRREQADSLRRAMASLPDRWRRLMWHLYCDPAAPSYAEVAQLLGIPEGSIGPTRARSLQRLQTILASMDESSRPPSLTFDRRPVGR